MKKYYLSTWLTFSLFVSTLCFANTSTDFKAERSELRFTENKGQVADLEGRLRPDILFTAHSRGVKLFVNQTGIHYQFMRSFEKPKAEGKENGLTKFDMPETDSTQFYRMDMQLVNANPNATVIKEGEGSDYENFYFGHCPNGVLGVKNYNRITYQNIYPNIDWVIYSKGNYMEYDFVVKPGGNVADIKIKYDGAIDLKVDAEGNLHASTPLGKISDTAPYAYQGNKQKVESKFLVQDNLLAFNIGEYNNIEELVIDPWAEWSTYYGGGLDYGNAVATDATGNVYLAGRTESQTGIASVGFQNNLTGVSDAYLVKFNSSGSRLWATYCGGAWEDNGNAVATDIAENVYLGGAARCSTSVCSSIATGGYQSTPGGSSDAFLIKFSSNGSRLWGTYFGGTGFEEGNSVATDAFSNVYLCGNTSSQANIASGGFQNSYGGGSFPYGDAFLVKFSSAGGFLWSTYYGGSDIDFGNTVTTAANGDVYMAGETGSQTGIASGGFQNTWISSQQAYLVKFNSTGSRLWGTYYGDTLGATGKCVTTDYFGNVYLAGATRSTSGIASGGFQNNSGGGGDTIIGNLILPYYDAYLVKFNSSGGRLWATYYGGSGDDFGNAVTTTKAGEVYLAGKTTSKSSIATGIFQNGLNGYGFNFQGTTASSDGFLVKFDNSGNRIWGIYYGGQNSDYATSIKVDTFDNFYLGGTTTSTSGIAYGGFQGTPGGAFLAKNSYPGDSCYYNCGGYMTIEADSLINYFDTLNVRVRITDPDNIYSIFAKLNYDSNLLDMVSSQVGDVLGPNIIHTPPPPPNGLVDFGMTRSPGQQGVNTDGLVYSFKFKLTNLPSLTFNAQNPSESFTTFNLSYPVVNDVTGLQRGIALKGLPDTTRIRYYVPVWPGDLNNDKSCNVADILPIGYFYGRTGPTRPNASLQWVAQPANLGSGNNWGLVKTNRNDNAWAVFADANGNGIVDLADQNALGFNLGKQHALTNNNNPVVNYSRSVDPPLASVITETQIDSTQLPYTLAVKINLGDLGTTASNVLGVAFNLLFDPECVDTNDITTTYTNLFGNLGSTYIKIEDFRNKAQGILGIGATRFNTSGISSNGDEVVTVTFKLRDGCYDGWFNVIPQILACNDPTGNDILLKALPDSVRINKANLPSALSDPLDLKNMVSLYPNPNKGTVFIKSSLKEVFSVEVYNSMGQLFLSGKKKGGDMIDLSEAAGGVYFVKVNAGGKTGVYKVVKE